MSRKGFADPVLLGAGALILVCLVVLGFSLYYFHGASLSKLVPQSPSISTSSTQQASTTPVAVLKTPTTTQATANSASGTCGSSMSCFIAAARTCSPASVEWSSTLNVFGAFIQITKSNLSLEGIVSGKCSYSSRVVGVSLAFTSSTIAQAQAQGITAAQMQEQLQQSDAQAQESVGTITKCTFTTSYLTQMLTNWSERGLSSDDLDPGNCTFTAANGKPIQVETGNSSIPLTSAGTTTIYLSASLTENGVNGLVFKLNSLTTSQLNVTITDSATGQSQAASFAVNVPLTVFGHTITVTNIGEVSNGTINGQPSYVEQATLTYN